MRASAFRRPLSAALLLVLAAPLSAETHKVPGDHDTIAEAINAAATGDVIQVSKGVYAENLFITTPGLTLKGKGATINGRYLADCVFVEADDFTIEGFTLVNGGGAALLQSPGDGVPQAALHVIGVGASISKLTVSAADGYGIILEGTGSVEQCKVDACVGPGLAVDTDSVTGTELTEIARNTVTRCQSGIQAASGPFTIEKNTVEQCGTGIEMIIPPLFLDGGPVVLATTVSKNSIRNNSEAGLEINKVSGPALLVEKNVVEENAFGISVEGFALDLDGNTIENNVFGGLVVFADACNVTKNKVRGNGSFGIVVGAFEKTDGGAAGENILSQNTVQDNGGDGIAVISSANEVHDCTVKGNTGDGIAISAGQGGNVIEGNKISDNGHDGIDNSGGPTTIAGNSSKNNGGADLAGAGAGAGSVVTEESVGNTVSDDSDIETFSTQGELDLDTV